VLPTNVAHLVRFQVHPSCPANHGLPPARPRFHPRQEHNLTAAGTCSGLVGGHGPSAAVVSVGPVYTRGIQLECCLCSFQKCLRSFLQNPVVVCPVVLCWPWPRGSPHPRLCSVLDGGFSLVVELSEGGVSCGLLHTGQVAPCGCWEAPPAACSSLVSAFSGLVGYLSVPGGADRAVVYALCTELQHCGLVLHE